MKGYGHFSATRSDLDGSDYIVVLTEPVRKGSHRIGIRRPRIYKACSTPNRPIKGELQRFNRAAALSNSNPSRPTYDLGLS